MAQVYFYPTDDPGAFTIEDELCYHMLELLQFNSVRLDWVSSVFHDLPESKVGVARVAEPRKAPAAQPSVTIGVLVSTQ